MTSDKETFNILKLSLIFIRRWILIAFVVFMFLIIGVIYSGIVDELYKSSVEIEFRSSSISRNIGNFNMFNNQLMPNNNLQTQFLLKGITEADLYAHIARTPVIIDRIIEKNDLFRIFKLTIMTHTRSRFLSKVDVKVNDLGLLEITFKDPDKNLAYNVILSYVEELENYYRNRLQKIREFSLLETESIINQVKNELFEAKNKFKEIQKKYGIFDVESYAKQTAEQIANLKYQLITAKIEYKVKYLEYFNLGRITKNELQIFQGKVDSIEKELNTLYNVTENSHIAYNQLPDINIEYMEEYTNVKSLEIIYEQLRVLYSVINLNMDEATSVFLVVNKPEVAEFKFYPVRTKIVLIFLIFGFAVSIMLCLVLNFFENAFKNPEDKKLILQMKEYLFFWNDKNLKNFKMAYIKTVFNLKKLKNILKNKE